MQRHDVLPNILSGGKYSQHQEGVGTSVPWGPQQPYLLGAFQEAARLYDKPIQYYPGQTVAGFAPEQRTAQSLATNRALLGSPLLGASQQYVYDTTMGKYLTPESNPYLKHYTERAFEETLPQLDTSAIQAGRYGSGAWGQMKGRTMADIQSNIYGQAYETDRERQERAAGMGPGMAREDYYDIGQLAAVGEEKQAMDQALKDAEVKKWEFEQMQPWERLSMYINAVTGDYGGTTTSTSKRRGK